LTLLSSIGRRCWIIFDRLDEAFPYNRDFERVALRGLLRAHLDIASYGNVFRTKLFLRTDVLDRVTEESGFVNATHMRARRIWWDHASIANLIVKRVFENKAFRDSFPSLPNTLTADEDRRAVTEAALPIVVEGQPLIHWLVQRTVDSHEEPNPRNTITLLEAARQRQLRVYERDDPDFGGTGPIIRAQAVISGFKDLSRIRLGDTLLAEFNHLRPYVERLRSRTVKYQPHLLAKALGLQRDRPKFQQVVDDLTYSGLLRASGGNYIVAMLYRPALDLQTTRPPTLKPEREEELRRIVMTAVDEIRNKYEARVLPSMKTDERRLVHELVSDIPDITSATQGVDPGKRIVLLPTPASDEPDE